MGRSPKADFQSYGVAKEKPNQTQSMFVLIPTPVWALELDCSLQILTLPLANCEILDDHLTILCLGFINL